MGKVIKRLPIAASLVSIGFLMVQIACALWLPRVTADIVDNGVRTGDIAYIWARGYLMIGLSVASMVGALCNTFMFSRISYTLGGELRSDIYRKVLSFSKAEFDKFGTSSLITRNTNDVTQVQTLVEGGLKFIIMAPAMLVGGIVMTWTLSPKLGLVFLCTAPVMAVGYAVIYRYASPLFAKMQKLLDSLNLFFREGLTGVKVIRAFGKDGSEYEKYKAANREYTRTSVTAATLMGVAVPLVTMLVCMSTVIIAWVGGKGVETGTVATGAIMAAISYSAQILTGFGMLTSVILAIPRGQISARRIYEVLDMPLGIEDPSEAKKPGPSGLAFEHVDFRYKGAGKQTLSDISFAVDPGQTLAIVGSTGDGKTTLVNLISRMYDVEGGSVKLGGVDVRDMAQEELRAMVSVTPQKSMLFFGTVRSNMLVGNPDATDCEIWAALGMAQATEFVAALPDGLDSEVEKGGGNFSGGQKQRLCMARALLKEAAVYVFDDSFSALDFKTDAQVREAIRPKLANAVTVIVAQRISSVLGADLIAVLDKGKLAGLGKHEVLLETCPVYREIVESQLYANAGEEEISA